MRAKKQEFHFYWTWKRLEYLNLNNRPLSTESALTSSTLYAYSKVATFAYLSEALKEKKTTFCWARIFYVFGRGEPKNKLFTYTINQLRNSNPIKLKSKDSKFDFIHIEQVHQHIIQIIEKKISGAINICTGKGLKTHEFCEKDSLRI